MPVLKVWSVDHDIKKTVCLSEVTIQDLLRIGKLKRFKELHVD